jgi:two-component system chemotaxis response regulator CheB
MVNDFEIIVIGGSSGCIPVLMQIIGAMPADFRIPVVIIIHRARNVESELETILSATKKIHEPEDKEPISENMLYLAPQNYHLLAEQDKTFCLDYSEPVNYSRPSIDVSFMSVSAVYRGKTLGILLSGANNDGAKGIDRIIRNGGRGIVQDPVTAQCSVMPVSALKINAEAEALTPDNIVKTIFNLN